VRNDVTGPSSGISTAFEDWRAEEARVDLVPDAVDVRVERVDVRPGMFAVSPKRRGVVGCAIGSLMLELLATAPLSVYIHIFPCLA
jgi:hypothetical protein